MNNIKYLPIGTLCSVNDSNQELMIVGYSVVVEKKYDYVGVPYPGGIINRDSYYFFDANQISKVVYEGYKNESYDQFITKYDLVNKVIDKKIDNNEVITIESILKEIEEES